MSDLDAGDAAEHDQADMPGGAVADGADALAARTPPRERDELREVLHRPLRRHCKGERNFAHDGDVGEIAHRVVGHVGVDRRSDRMHLDVGEAERVAVRRRLRHHVGAERAARAGAILHNDRLIERRR